MANSHSSISLDHMPNASCETCHDREAPSELKLASGLIIPLENVQQLCQQCHKTEVADWSVGIHGKQVGNWQKKIHRFSCTKCHDPHKPAFGTMIALPPPAFPKFGIPKTH